MGENISELGEKAIGQAPKFIDSLARLFPGIARGSEARGVSSAHKTMMRDLERTRDEAERLGLPAATTDALCLEVISGYSKTENLSGCLSFAESSVHDDASGDNVDPSWLLRWQDGAENQCEDEMRVIWGQLLAGELEQPGSYSKRTLSILADMGKTTRWHSRSFAEFASEPLRAMVSLTILCTLSNNQRDSLCRMRISFA